MLITSLLVLCGMGAAQGGTMCELHVVQEENAYRVEVRSDGKAVLTSPSEGLWSVATDWREGWPVARAHGQATEMEKAGDWIILRGAITTPGGTWRVSDCYLPQGGLIKCVRRFVWEGKEVAERCTLSVRFQSPGSGDGVLMPGILYYGNPSGAKSGRVPVYTGKPGEEAIYEEHRFPMPFVSLEWQDGDRLRGAALHSLPSPVACANLPDQWWSMGIVGRETGSEFTLLSGPCASNGKRSVVKAIQPGFVPMENAYLNVTPGRIIEKIFYLQAYPVAEKGSGFQTATRSSLALFAPAVAADMPAYREIIEAKHRFAKTRWLDAGDRAGFKMFPNKDFIVLGWCGQAAAPGYAFQVLNTELKDPKALEMAQRSLDTLSDPAYYEGGFHTWFNCTTKEWARKEPLSQGQGMLNFARAIKAAEKTKLDTSKWRAFLQQACSFHAKRILAADWNPKSTDEAFFIAPLCAGYRLFKDESMREAAIKAGTTYAGRCLHMEEPYWGGTLDASCEDKEGAFAALQGFLALHELTGEAKYRTWAEHACDVALTYVVVWDIDLPPGRLRDHGFKTRGWTAVSPQNQHIDVYGVLIAPDVYRMGQLTGRQDLKDLAELMFRSCGQLMDAYGSQGEQPQHTNYAQRGDVSDVFALRGGYVEDWTVFWITAHFLNAAAQLQELGIDLWRP